VVSSPGNMKIVNFQFEPILEIPYLNAGRGPGQFYESRLPIHLAQVDRLPDGVSAIVITGDLQGRERFEEAGNGPIRLLGEVLPRRLIHEVFPLLDIRDFERVGALLAGDFYTVPTLDKRGGTGDVIGVWHAFSEHCLWVAGVPGNHDMFGEPPQRRPRFPGGMHFLDGDVIEVGELRIAGLGGIVGHTSRPNRRSEDDYLATLQQLLEKRPHLIVMHDGPDGPLAEQRGMTRVREILLDSETGLVIRGHAHWDQPFAAFDSGLQVLNVDARVVVLTT
jgi:Icc protein